MHADYNICDRLSESSHSLHIHNFFFSALSTVFKERAFKFQLNEVSSFEIIAVDSTASKKIDLNSNHTENKLQALNIHSHNFSLNLSIALEFGLKCSKALVIGQPSKL